MARFTNEKTKRMKYPEIFSAVLYSLTPFVNIFIDPDSSSQKATNEELQKMVRGGSRSAVVSHYVAPDMDLPLIIGNNNSPLIEAGDGGEIEGGDGSEKIGIFTVRLAPGISSANVRADGSTDAIVVGTVLNNSELDVYDFRNGWYLVQIETGDFGWISEVVGAYEASNGDMSDEGKGGRGGYASSESFPYPANPETNPLDTVINSDNLWLDTGHETRVAAFQHILTEYGDIVTYFEEDASNVVEWQYDAEKSNALMLRIWAIMYLEIADKLEKGRRLPNVDVEKFNELSINSGMTLEEIEKIIIDNRDNLPTVYWNDRGNQIPLSPDMTIAFRFLSSRPANAEPNPQHLYDLAYSGNSSTREISGAYGHSWITDKSGNPVLVVNHYSDKIEVNDEYSGIDLSWDMVIGIAQGMITRVVDNMAYKRQDGPQKRPPGLKELLQRLNNDLLVVVRARNSR